MKIIFISNYINHHQMPFSECLYQATDGNYRFIQVMPMEEERISMGWGVDMDSLPYLLLYQQEKDLCDELILTADVVIYGGAEHHEIIEPRLDAHKFTLIYSERLYREGKWKCVSPRGLIRKYHEHIKYRKFPAFLMCAGSYVASDFGIIHAYPKKKVKWGYFPKFVATDVAKLLQERALARKNSGLTQILWVGRTMKLKHPDNAIQLVSDLKKLGYRVHLTMVGAGEMDEQLHNMTNELKLNDDITFEPFKSPAEIREYMNHFSIFLFLSDYREGWGAVVNESMNSGCAVVASGQAGATNYLIKDGYNGMIFNSKCYETLLMKVKSILDDEKLMENLSLNAYRTIETDWNVNTASERLLDFCNRFLSSGEIVYEDEGVFSAADRGSKKLSRNRREKCRPAK